MRVAVNPATVRVLLFARYAELAGTAATELTLSARATVADVLRDLRARFPGAAALPERPLVAVNLRQVPMDHPVVAGDEVAILPPLSGG